MIRSIPTRAFQSKDSAKAVLAMLNSEDLLPERAGHYPYPSGSAVAIALPRMNAKIDDAGTDADVAPLASALLPRSQWGVAIEDWDVLFSAVIGRLRLIVAERLATTAEPQLADEADRIRVNVLECVAALDQLHAMLKDGLGHL